MMTEQEIITDIINYGIHIATVTNEDPDKGILTGQLRNQLLKNDVLWIADSSQEIVRGLVAQAKQVLQDQQPDDYESGMLFQYIFDKTVEVTYKVITKQEVDTQLKVSEIFDYYKIDVPAHIQHNLKVKVPQIALIHHQLKAYITEKGYQSEPLDTWLFGFLLTAVSIAISFTSEMDLNDISGLQEYLEKEEK